ncbi:MAG: class I SAM-dependent methyltransferase [Candidatus Thorarchaeota archaeon]|jgi:2-polyprenyl-3-methyl-5-hydroxy-6-metoxy-1,4-benzoquinol methylase
MKHIDAVSKAREKDAEQIMRLVRIDDRTVLESGCGTRRIAIPLAEKAREIVAIDIDASAIEEARKENRFENVTFLVENIETTQLGRKFDVVLSTWLGYMFLNDIPKAIANISYHLEEDGIFLLCSSSPEDEYNQIVDMLVAENVKSTSFYNELEKHLSDHFVFEKHILKGLLSFTHMEEVMDRFRSELKTEHRTLINNQHEQRLKEYMIRKESLAIGWDSQAYLCKKR